MWPFGNNKAKDEHRLGQLERILAGEKSPLFDPADLMGSREETLREIEKLKKKLGKRAAP